MNPVSPFSLLGRISPAAHVLGTIAADIAEHARGKGGLAGAFSDAYSGLDANDDGSLNGADVIGHAVGLRNAVLGGIADMLGIEKGTDDGTDDGTDGTAGGPGAARNGPAPAGTRTAANDPVPPPQAFTASAPPALPSAPAARALENLPGVAEIRATYTTLRTLH
jgi:hypothetical protein